MKNPINNKNNLNPQILRIDVNKWIEKALFITFYVFGVVTFMQLTFSVNKRNPNF